MRRLLALFIVPISLVALTFLMLGQWPWYAAWLLGILYAVFVQPLPWLRQRPWLYTTSFVYLAFGLWVVPLGRLFGLTDVAGFWLITLFLVEVGLSVVAWIALRPRFAGGLDFSVRLGWAFGAPRQVLIAQEDRFLHLHVLGPTGSGKTVGVLGPSLRQDVRQRAGLLVLDPKGDLASIGVEEATRMGRPHTALAPGEAPQIGLDPFAGPRERAAETVAYALSGAFPSGHEFYRTVGQAMLRNAALALKEALERPTLQDLERLMQSEEFRREVLLEVADPHVRAYFRDQVGGWSARFRQDAFIGVQSAVAQVLAHPWARQLFDTRPSVDFDRLLAEGGMLFLTLPEGELGLAASAVGAFALMAFQAASLRREQGPPAFVYADEFQTFAQADFGAFLAEARSHRVGAVLAHQHLGQLPVALRQAVISNARNRVLLGGLSRDDLEALRESLGTRYVAGPQGLRQQLRFDFETMRRMPRGQAVAEVCIRGQNTPPVRMRLLGRA